jgi:hypothetical protein
LHKSFVYQSFSSPRNLKGNNDFVENLKYGYFGPFHELEVVDF